MSERVVETVADRVGADPLELDPLYRRIDPDCLDNLFPDDEAVDGSNVGRVEFGYAGHRVTVARDGSVEVSSAVDGDAESARRSSSLSSSGESNTTEYR